MKFDLLRNLSDLVFCQFEFLINFWAMEKWPTPWNWSIVWHSKTTFRKEKKWEYWCISRNQNSLTSVLFTIHIGITRIVTIHTGSVLPFVACFVIKSNIIAKQSTILSKKLNPKKVFLEALHWPGSVLMNESDNSCICTGWECFRILSYIKLWYVVWKGKYPIVTIWLEKQRFTTGFAQTFFTISAFRFVQMFWWSANREFLKVQAEATVQTQTNDRCTNETSDKVKIKKVFVIFRRKRFG